jgi:hypothetical protein
MRRLVRRLHHDDCGLRPLERAHDERNPTTDTGKQEKNHENIPQMESKHMAYLLLILGRSTKGESAQRHSRFHR